MISRENHTDRIQYFRRIILLSVAALVMMTCSCAPEDFSNDTIPVAESGEDAGQTEFFQDAWLPEEDYPEEAFSEDLFPEGTVSDEIFPDVVTDETADSSMMQEIFPEEELLIGEEIFEEEEDTEPFTVDETDEQFFRRSSKKNLRQNRCRN